MNADKKYNGWTNYETWAVKLWMDNDEGSDSYWRDEAKSALERAIDDPSDVLSAKEDATANLADIIKEQHEEALPEVNGFASDLLNAAMSEVNWWEIASHYVDEAAEEMEADERNR